MARRYNLLRQIAGSMKRKAKNAATQTLYMAMWQQPVPKGKKKI